MSTNIDQIVWKGFEAIQKLSEQSSIPELATTAKDLSKRLGRGVRGPTAAYIATQGESAASKDDKDSMCRFVKVVENLPSEYKDPVFQCLGDYMKAKKTKISPFLIGFVMAICLANKLLKIEIKLT